jgi:hypothetical protein
MHYHHQPDKMPDLRTLLIKEAHPQSRQSAAERMRIAERMQAELNGRRIAG